MRAITHPEDHRLERIGWLRAAVLGANDGIVSVASLLIGVAASSGSRDAIVVAGVAGLVGGAASMAAGEYVSVGSQRDTEQADIAREERELAHDPETELEELTTIYVERGLDQALARDVARALTAADPLGAHLRDELGMSEHQSARPGQAAAVSATGFALGATLPVVAAPLAPGDVRAAVVAGVALVLLAVTGAIGGRIGGATPRRAALRVLAGGSLAMALTAGIGALVGTAI
jgi:VIT1/CCC1 family predicted Fe2+/Mn2+ transporter